MKNKPIFLILLLLTVVTFGQGCPKYYTPGEDYLPSQFSVYKGTEDTTGGEIAIQLRKMVYGFGIAGFTGNIIEDTPLRNKAIYGIVAFQVEDFIVGSRVGVGSNITFIGNRKVLGNDRPLVGLFIRYNVLRFVGVGIGYDTFNKGTYGVTLSF